jgi:hypothetical protein
MNALTGRIRGRRWSCLSNTALISLSAAGGRSRGRRGPALTAVMPGHFQPPSMTVDMTGRAAVSESENLGTPGDPQFDWAQARGFLSRRLARKLFREDHATLDDLTQEALVRVLRAARRETVLNLEGLMETIAERTVADFLRSRRIWQKDPTIYP